MAKYVMLKHYRGGKGAVNDVPMNQWAPEEIDAHIQYMEDFATRSGPPGSSSMPRRWPRADCEFASTERAGRR